MKQALRPSQKLALLARTGRLLRVADVERRGISRVYLSRMERTGQLTRVARGVYRRPDAAISEHHSLVQVASRNKSAVVCLLSALAFHRLGTQNPFEVWIALPKGARTPVFETRTRIVRLSTETYSLGVEKHQVEGVRIRVYSIAKTIVDCFRFRNQIGLDVALEALKTALREKRTTIAEIRKFAKPARMTRVMQPYLEAM
jgi:predicted transcriptional regulator of viral defense system